MQSSDRLSSRLQGLALGAGASSSAEPTATPASAPPPASGGSSSFAAWSSHPLSGSAAQPPAFPLAPYPSAASPFREVQAHVTRIVLAQIHPDLGITRGALAVVMRLQDRLAHWLIHRAYFGEAPSQQSALGGVDDQQAPRPSYTFSEVDPPIEEHTIVFRLPERVSAPEIERNARQERQSALTALHRAAADPESVFDFVQCGLQFGHPLAQRWMDDFLDGLHGKKEKANGKGKGKATNGKPAATAAATGPDESKEDIDAKEAAAAAAASDDEEATPSSVAAAAGSAVGVDSKASSGGGVFGEYPARLQLMESKVALCALVEYLTAELLELAGNRTLESGDDVVNPLDLWCAISRDEDLWHIARFLAVDWHVTPGGLDISAIDPIGTRQTDLPPLTQLLEFEFAAQIASQNQMNASSWYCQPQRLASVAKEFARGLRQESPITKSLRALHVRPYRFWGCDTNSYLSEQPSHQPNDDALDDDDREANPADGFVYVSVLVEDKAGESWHLMLEIAPRQHWRGSVIELETIGGPLGKFRQQVVRGGQTSDVDVTSHLHVQLGAVACLRKSGGVAYQPHGTHEVVSCEDDVELELAIMSKIRELQDQLERYTKRKREEARVKAEWARRNEERQTRTMPALPLDASTTTSSSSGGGGIGGPLSPSDSSVPVPVSRAHRHPLVWFPRRYSGRFECNECMRNLGTGAWACDLCAFDLCASCYQRSANYIKPTEAKADDAAAVPSSSASGPSSGVAHDLLLSAVSGVSSFLTPFAGSTGAPTLAPALAPAVFDPLSILTVPIPVAPTATVFGVDGEPIDPPSSSAGPRLPLAAPGSRPNITYASTSRLDVLHASLMHLTAQVARSHAQTELERVIPQLIHLIRFSQYGPTMYVANQPASLRRQFTVTLVDEAMGATPELPSLPTDLLGLIADYLLLDLPFLEAEASQQMKSLGNLAFPPTRALYPGQINNPVERHELLATAHDEIFEPFGHEMQHGEDEEDDEEDEEDEEEENEEEED